MLFRSYETFKEIGAKYIKYLLEVCDSDEDKLKVFSVIYPTLKSVLWKEVENKNGKFYYYIKKLAKAMKIFINGPPMIDIEEVIELCKILKRSLENNIMIEIPNSIPFEQSGNINAKGLNKIPNNTEIKENTINSIMEISGVIGKLYGLQCQSIFNENLIPYFINLWENSNDSISLRLSILCFFCDMIEYFHEGDWKEEIIDKVQNMFTIAIKMQNDSIMQSASYGLGLISQYFSNQFKSILPDAVPSLLEIIEKANAQSDNRTIEIEYAISALIKISLFSFDHESIGTSSLAQFLELLPLRIESEEAQNIHKILLEQTKLKNAIVMENIDAVKNALERIEEYSRMKSEVEAKAIM